MKNLYILGLIIGILLLLGTLWFYVKINVICTVSDGVMYDGFGYAYVYQEPHCPYTIWMYVLGVSGIGVIGVSRDKLIKLRDNKM